MSLGTGAGDRPAEPPRTCRRRIRHNRCKACSLEDRMFQRAGSRCQGILCCVPAWWVQRLRRKEERGWAESKEQLGQGQRSGLGFAEKSPDFWRRGNAAQEMETIVMWEASGLSKAVLPLRRKRGQHNLRSRERACQGLDHECSQELDGRVAGEARSPGLEGRRSCGGRMPVHLTSILSRYPHLNSVDKTHRLL